MKNQLRKTIGTLMTQLKPPQRPPLWNHTVDDIVEFTDALIKESAAMDDFVASTFDKGDGLKVVEAFSELENRHAPVSQQLTFYQHVSASKELRDASNAAEEKLEKFAIESGMREDVYKTLLQIYQDYKDVKSIDPETSRYIEKVYKKYERNGFGQPPEIRQRIKELKEKLSEISITFSKNLVEDTGFILFSEKELTGVPQDVVTQFAKVEDPETKVVSYKMTFKYPDIFPVLKYAQNPYTRRRAFVGDQNKVPENAGLLVEAVKLRSELANLLGYQSFAAYVQEERMSKNPENVWNFLLDLKDKLHSQGVKERETLLDLKKHEYEQNGWDYDGEYYVWDHRYYDNKLLENEYKVDATKIAEYFPLQATIGKMLEIFETLFKLKFAEDIEEEDKSVWHPDVKQFAVWKMDDLQNPEFAGWLYFDLHPRDGKYGHAANFGLAPGFTKTDESRAYPVTALVCNFSQPTESKPSLLKHDEVNTFFHELGHGIHDLLGKTKYSRFHGTSVSWDFVECPSQMLEYWTWSPKELKFLSSHFLNPEESLPEELITSLVRSKNVNGGLFNLRQLHFGIFDMKLHSLAKGESVDVISCWNDMREEIALVSSKGITTKGFGSFGHLLGGYGAGYYGYLWSQVFAADIYYSMFKADPMDSKKGCRYRDIILSRGGSRDELENLQELLGRDPSNEAFLKELGM